MTDEKKAPPQRQRLVDIALGHFGGGRDSAGDVYLVPNDGPNVALHGKAAKRALGGELYELDGQVPGRTPLDEAWMVIEHNLHQRPKAELPLRVGTHEGRSVVDVGDGTAIVIDDDGWEVVERSPITFAQTAATMPLPHPVRGGDVERLFELINVAPSSERLVLGWLVSTLTLHIAHPIIVLRGPMGSAKSTTAKVLARAVDPTAAPIVSPPRDEDRWDATCSGHWVAAIDNVSNVPPWWSDSLCRVVTGTGAEKRKLYTDGGLHVSSYRRCPILNGISLTGMLRPDLLERSIALDLETPAERITDAEMESRIVAALPEVLGGLLDLAVKVRTVEVDAPELPRMADFGLILAELDTVLGGGPVGVDAYREQLDELFDESLESDPIARAVIELMKSHTDWEGPTDELLRELVRIKNEGGEYWSTRSGDYWPSNATQLGNALKRSRPLIAQSGVKVESIKVGHRSERKRGTRLTHGGGVDGVDGVDGTFSTLCVLKKEEEEEETQVRESAVPAVHPSTAAVEDTPPPVPINHQPPGVQP